MEINYVWNEEMKINYEKIQNPNAFEKMRKLVLRFTIKQSILKPHFKLLARMSVLFKHDPDVGAYVGNISLENESDFYSLLKKIEDSDSKKSTASHQKSKIKLKQKQEKFCEHSDLGSLGYAHGTTVNCPNCGKKAEVW